MPAIIVGELLHCLDYLIKLHNTDVLSCLEYLHLVDQFINDKIKLEIRPAMDMFNEKIAQSTEIVDTNSARIKDLNNEKKDINKKLDNLLDLKLAKGVDQRLIDKENQLKYRLQQIEEELEGIDVNTGGKYWWNVWHELQSELFTVPIKWKSENTSVRNAFLKKYMDKIVYTKNNLQPNEPKLEIHYTEKVSQDMEVYEQYRKEQEIRVNVRKQKAIADGTYWGLIVLANMLMTKKQLKLITTIIIGLINLASPFLML